MSADQREICSVVARRGTVVTCASPSCGKRIATFVKNLAWGAPDVGVDLLEFEEGQKRDHGTHAICLTCGTPFWKASYSMRSPLPRHEIHTPEGWLVLTPHR